jgi:sulfur-carrier protein adenylyltransferase/sulfurtransferase
MTEPFSYSAAFARNIGWVTPEEQAVLRRKRVALAGMGGVGGSHLLTLARLGVGAFNIADFDVFDIANFNRQVGATVSSIGKPKVDVLAAMARDINPELDIRVFPRGVDAANLPDFLDGVDLYVDGLDFFAFAARQATFAACWNFGIPAITAAPLGMGTAFPDRSGAQGLASPLSGRPLHREPGRAPWAVDHHGVPTLRRRGRHGSLEMPAGAWQGPGCPAWNAVRCLQKQVRAHLAAGGQQPPLAARGLEDRLAANRQAEDTGMTENGTVAQILELARWAPSGDNTQPWWFEVIDDRRVVVHGSDTRDHCVYDLDGRPSQISLGALLETMSIAATAHGLSMKATRRMACPETTPTFDVEFTADAACLADPLLASIPERRVQRRAMKTRPLTTIEKTALESAVGSDYEILWLESFSARFRAARLMFNNAKLRLTMPEAYPVHRDVIQWNAQFSEDRIPDQALGIDQATARLMRFVLGSWRRVEFFNTWLAGTLLPRLQLDLIPGLACAAHFVMKARRQPASVDDFVAAGRAVQRFWLTATQLGLFQQPEMTPLIFGSYVRKGVHFTSVAKLQAQARNLEAAARGLIGPEAERAVWMGRVGAGPAPSARSTRRPLETLMRPRELGPRSPVGAMKQHDGAA